MEWLKPHLEYLDYVCRHIKIVRQECFKEKLYWQGLTHDWSKFLPDEWFPYVRWFYGIRVGARVSARTHNLILWRVPIVEIDESIKPMRVRVKHRGRYWWFSKDELEEKKSFDRAVRRHLSRHRHHHDNWGGAEMPLRFVIEMLADWKAAGTAQGKGDDSRSHYLRSREKMNLHPNTRAEVERRLGIS